MHGQGRYWPWRAFGDIKGANNFDIPDISDNLCEYDNIKKQKFPYISMADDLQNR